MVSGSAAEALVTRINPKVIEQEVSHGRDSLNIGRDSNMSSPLATMTPQPFAAEGLPL